MEFGFKWMDKGAKHIKQHALATVLNHFEHLHIDQCCKNNGFLAVHAACMVDFTHRLVSLVNRVNERQSYLSKFIFKLGKNSVAKSFCSNAGAIRNKKYCSVGHGFWGSD